METSILTPTQRYAAAALFALALHQSQVHQTKPLNSLVPLEEEPIGERVSDGKSASVSEDPLLWVHEKSGLLWHIFRFVKRLCFLRTNAQLKPICQILLFL